MMKKTFLLSLAFFFFFSTPLYAKKLFVVTTLSTYASIAKAIGKDKVKVVSLVESFQDPHFMTPKPSKALILSKADVFVSTGLDLELWAPTLIDKSGNAKIRSGQIGYVSASQGIKLLEKPVVFSRSGGGLHIYGNPHFYNSPLTGFTIARNITIGLKKNDPNNAAFYDKNLKFFEKALYERLFGKKLLRLLGRRVLFRLAESGRLMSFLHRRSYRGKKLIEYAGGWFKVARKLYNRKVVAYHKNWTYFSHLFGMKLIDYIEPKPGIPPSPKHVEEVIEKMRLHKIKVIIAANYYPEGKVRHIAKVVHAKAVILSLMPHGKNGIESYFSLFDDILNKITSAFNS